MYKAVCITLLLGFLGAQSALATSNSCLGCHDFGPDSPVHPLLDGQHGDTEAACATCHGASEEHTRRPTAVAPEVSYGPRWSASVGAQDAQCLACHEKGVAQHWGDALHMVNALTCVSCHDLHTTEDKVLRAEGQAHVCTICHKPQKQGIHALTDKLHDNPVCTTCHNPHADQRPLGVMLANRSEGCRSCHDLVAMAASDSGTAKARSYHKIMAQSDRTCLDCHGGIAHGPADAVAPFLPFATASRKITLFYPGQSDIDWILSEHPGSQPFRQGTNCQQCHRGEEAGMGTTLGKTLVTEGPTSRDLDIGFREDADNLYLSISWLGDADDTDVALMWGDDGNSAFRRGGCFAACHGDMPGLSRDRGQELDKYLMASRKQLQRIGQPPLLKDAAELQQMIAAGNFVEMWRISLGDDGASASTAVLLAGLDWADRTNLQALASYADGRWTLSLQRPLEGNGTQKSFAKGRTYTFGIALHSAQRAGGKHWVSLPMTLGLDAEDTDFRAD